MPLVREVNVRDWTGFEAEVGKILDSFQASRGCGTGHSSNPLFRGHADQRWPLATTLERFSNKSWSIEKYYRLVLSVLPAINSLTPRAWELDPHMKVDEGYLGPPPGYEFMIYLRHHGFPSPLLDWTRSPYVAAFFAFASRPPPGCEAVAVYGFREYVGQGKTWSGGEPYIIGLGPYAVTHERHYAQQCEYTICKKQVGTSHHYCSHEEALQIRGEEQNIMTKLLIPATERGRFMRKLDSMNIHAYSLLRDETALIKTLAFREIEEREDP